jgi:outer membrane protein
MRSASLGMMLSLATGAGFADGTLPDHLVGNVGAAVYATERQTNRPHESPLVLPFVYADYERLFARVDTFGVKTLELGYGYLEFVGRVSIEGSKDQTLHMRQTRGRSNPLPIGLGTFQETPIGGFFLYSLYDTRSGGTLLESTYATEFTVRGITLYPQAGIEKRSARYEQHLRGVTAQQATAGNFPIYTPGASTTPLAALAADVPLSGSWLMNLQWRRQWYGQSIRKSPLTGNSHFEDTGFLAISRTFK